jgi:hypothetical protein
MSMILHTTIMTITTMMLRMMIIMIMIMINGDKTINKKIDFFILCNIYTVYK